MAARLPASRMGFGPFRRMRWGIGGRGAGLIVKRRCRALVRPFATDEDDFGGMLELAARKGTAHVRRGVVQPHLSNHVAHPDGKALFAGTPPGPHMSLDGVGSDFVRL